ncbi:LytR/AlgR family response regulator transcription factor [Jiulongibacter sp. NS-SX5]|uniref:LytR/AlgR family response regulator transcription factor n=1 Tax=Jiulongibacter sp. NS-SX5 TaxID=3463854 RepID=UPI004059C07E
MKAMTETLAKILQKKKYKSSDIIYLKADYNYTFLQFKNNDSFTSSYTLKTFQKALEDNENFKRIHRSCVVNMSYVRKVSNDETQLILRNGEKLSISRRQKRSILSKLEV